jgi:hypothetical protein
MRGRTARPEKPLIRPEEFILGRALSATRGQATFSRKGRRKRGSE